MLTYDDRPKHAPDHRGEKRHGNDRVDDGSSAKRHRHNEHPESQSGGKPWERAGHSHSTSSRLNEYEVGKDISDGGAKVRGGFLKGTLRCTHILIPGDGGN